MFDAYDNWNIKMLNVWNKEISELEDKAVEILGDAEIDRIFEQVSMSISDMLYEDWSKVIGYFPVSWDGEYPEGRFVVL